MFKQSLRACMLKLSHEDALTVRTDDPCFLLTLRFYLLWKRNSDLGYGFFKNLSHKSSEWRMTSPKHTDLLILKWLSSFWAGANEPKKKVTEKCFHCWRFKNAYISKTHVWISESIKLPPMSSPLQVNFPQILLGHSLIKTKDFQASA